MKTASITKTATINQDVAATNAPGYEAQGFALAQTMQAVVKSHAQDLRRMVNTAWSLDSKAREYAQKYMREFLDTCKKNAESTRPHEGIDAKQWGKIARSATVRVSQFNTIIKAMNAGMTIGTVAGMLGLQHDDVANVGFDTLVQVARDYNGAQSTGNRETRGRAADPFAVALAKWMAKHEPKDKKDHDLFDKVKTLVAETQPDAPF